FQPGDLTVVLRMPDSADVQGKNEIARKAAEMLMTVPQVQNVWWNTIGAAPEVTLFLSGAAGKAPELRAALAKLTDAQASVCRMRHPVKTPPGEGMDIVARVKEIEPEDVDKIAGKLRQAMCKIPGVVDAHIEAGMSKSPRLYIDVDRTKTKAMNVN